MTNTTNIPINNDEIFYKKNFTFLIQRDVNGELLKVLRDTFRVIEVNNVLIIEKKEKEEFNKDN